MAYPYDPLTMHGCKVWEEAAATDPARLGTGIMPMCMVGPTAPGARTMPGEPGYDDGVRQYTSGAGHAVSSSCSLNPAGLPGTDLQGVAGCALLFPHPISNATVVLVVEVSSNADPSVLAVDHYHVATGWNLRVYLWHWGNSAWDLIGTYTSLASGDGAIAGGSNYRQAGQVRCRITFDATWDNPGMNRGQPLSEVFAGLHYLTWS